MVKIDMEAKLRAWLESKGKTKSAHRMAVRGTPIVSKTPTSVCSAKKTINHSCRKVKASPKQDASNAEDRYRKRVLNFCHVARSSGYQNLVLYFYAGLYVSLLGTY